jgi:hypothetical protein
MMGESAYDGILYSRIVRVSGRGVMVYCGDKDFLETIQKALDVSQRGLWLIEISERIIAESKEFKQSGAQ